MHIIYVLSVLILQKKRLFETSLCGTNQMYGSKRQILPLLKQNIRRVLSLREASRTANKTAKLTQ